MLQWIALALATPSNADIAEAIADDAGWEDVGSSDEPGVGAVTARHMNVDGVDCLEASAVTALPVDTLQEVILDIRGNIDWSSAELAESSVLSEKAGRIDYLQVLKLPAPFASRYWFLRGEVTSGAEGADSWSFAWQRLDGPSSYPEAYAGMVKRYGEDMVEVGINVGSWALLPAEDGTTARFRSCTNVGGSVPRWAGEKAARIMLPNNIVDLVVEAERRASK
jgi:hypothetical protein